MSLINDALKRAGQQPPPPRARLELRPAEAGVHPGRGVGVLAPAVLGLIVIGAVLYLWPSRHGSGVSRPAPLEKPAARIEAAPAPAAGPPAPTPPAATIITASEPAAPALPETGSAGPGVTPAATGAGAEPSPSSAAPPPAPALKLQGIIFQPGRSSANLNGRVVFTGERVGEWRVAEITRDTVTLAGAEGKVVLSLP